uniref:Uncharacterized protein n=1 Tax=viral metagenome TaxID=1070528 RepID=A0A6M3MHW8_9ZZZZ
MEMDVRDIAFWTREAQIRVLMKRAESYAASILPHREAKDVNAEIDKLKWEFYNFEHEDEINEIEKIARERLDKIREKRKR